MERAGSMTSSYYSSCHGIMLIYDVTEQCTLSSLRRWIENASSYARGSQASYFLVGNKIDENASEIKVDTAKAEHFSKNLEIPIAGNFRISAKTGEGVQEMFSSVLARIAATVAPAEPVTHIFAAAYDEPDGPGCKC